MRKPIDISKELPKGIDEIKEKYNFLEQLLNLAESIDGDPVISILPPKYACGGIGIRIEWYLNQKYGYQEIFSGHEIDNFDRVAGAPIDRFVRSANLAYSEAVKAGQGEQAR